MSTPALSNPFGLEPAGIEERAREIRRRIVQMNSAAGQGHTGADLSEADILATLFFRVLRYSPQRPADQLRDRFVLSKGHGVGGFYCTLAEAGIIPAEVLSTYLKFDSPLPGHPVRQKTPFVEINTGALGHGLSVGVGLALSARVLAPDPALDPAPPAGSAPPFQVYVLLGDGELQEGSNWEAAMSAAQFRLGNLVAIVDRNSLQLADRTESIMALEPLEKKWEAFGFDVATADGNNPEDLLRALDEFDPAGEAPHVLLARTVKGKGVSFMEDQAAWHHKIPVGDQLRQAIEELE
ncbi:MAG TPA: transketolase [bacterium]|nr:transketolase [bacterium]